MSRIIREYNRLPVHLQRDVKPLNALSGAEWAQASKSVQVYGGAIAQKRRAHGAAFPLSLAQHLISLFTQPGDVVLDPFLGVGTTADACTLMDRTCVGFEVNERFYALAAAGLDHVDRPALPITPREHRLINESCARIAQHVEPESIDLTITSPPYGNLLRRVAAHFANYTYQKNIYRNQGRVLPAPYSDDPEDFGNLAWPEYLAVIKRLMSDLYAVSKPGAYNAWVVRDFRDVEHHHPYIPVHAKIAELMGQCGWVLTDVVIWNQSDQRKLVKLGGIKQRRFYFNIGHSYVVISRKNLPGERFVNIW